MGGNSETSGNEIVLNDILLKYTTCLQMDMPESENQVLPDNNKNSNSKQEFYFLSDVLPEDKVHRSPKIWYETYVYTLGNNWYLMKWIYIFYRI